MLRDAVAVEDARLHMHYVHLDEYSLARNLWYYSDLPEIAAQLGADVVHLSYPSPVNRRRMHCPVVVTVHDLYAQDIPENFGFPKVIFNRLVFRQCLRAADALTCVSNATLERLRSWAPAMAAKATRIYNCVEPTQVRIGRSPVPRCRNVPFLLCVAQHRRNKNIVLAVKTLAKMLREKSVHAETMLLVIGMAGPETETIERCIEAEGVGQNVLLLSGISETELQWCYRNCEVLLAPSLMEGFGLPVAEGSAGGMQDRVFGYCAVSRAGGRPLPLFRARRRRGGTIRGGDPGDAAAASHGPGGSSANIGEGDCRGIYGVVRAAGREAGGVGERRGRKGGSGTGSGRPVRCCKQTETEVCPQHPNVNSLSFVLLKMSNHRIERSK